jgi:hypothetical protein
VLPLPPGSLDPDGTPLPDGTFGPNRDARGTRIVPGLRLGEGGPLVGSVEVGWARLTHRDESPLLPEYRGLVGGIDLLYRPGDRTRIRLKAERRVDFSVSNENDYYVYDEVALGAVRYLNRWVGLEVLGAAGDLSIPGIERNDDILRWGGGLRFRILENSMGRRVEYSLTLQRERRDSSVSAFTRTRNLVGFGAVLGF